MGRVYLSGTLRGRVPASPQTVAVSDANGGTVSLTYATPSILHGWPVVGIYEPDLTVQIRHVLGTEVPRLVLNSEKADLSPYLARQLPE